MRKLQYYFLFALLTFFIWSCQKELSVENNGANNGGGGTNVTYGWSFNANTTNAYKGCIDTAFYATQSGVKALVIEGTDSVNNNFYIFIAAPSGKINTGTYTAAQGAGIIAQLNGTAFTATQNSDLSIKITTVNDTLVEGSFSGTITDPIGGGTEKITDGKFKALIGKANPCSGTNPPPSSSTAVFTLVGTQANCSDAQVQGTYTTGSVLEAANKVTIKVNVTTAGTWTISTGTVNGIKFSGSGNFTTTGEQVVTLQGSGTPTTAGAAVMPVTVGNSSCSFSVTVVASTTVPPGSGDYFPTTNNSSWVYYYGQPGAYTDSSIAESTGITKQIGGKTYTGLDDILAGLYRKENGVYYRYGIIDFFELADSVQQEVPFLKDNVAKNTSWESPIADGELNGAAIKLKTKFTIMEKDISMTVMGKSYSKVIVVKEELMASAAGSPYMPVTEVRLSYAKGIGVIQIKDITTNEVIEIQRFEVF